MEEPRGVAGRRLGGALEDGGCIGKREDLGRCHGIEGGFCLDANASVVAPGHVTVPTRVRGGHAGRGDRESLTFGPMRRRCRDERFKDAGRGRARGEVEQVAAPVAAAAVVPAPQGLVLRDGVFRQVPVPDPAKRARVGEGVRGWRMDGWKGRGSQAKSWWRAVPGAGTDGRQGDGTFG